MGNARECPAPLPAAGCPGIPCCMSPSTKSLASAIPSRSPLASHWALEPGTVFLNHGSFGATPRPVLERQRACRDLFEAEPIRFVVEILQPMLDAARARLADFLNADAAGLVFVPNATAGVNTVLNSLRFEPGDELLFLNQGYNACRCALEFTAKRWGAAIKIVDIPFPIEDPQQTIDAVLAAVTPRTKLALLDHITSPTALVLPIPELVPLLEARSVFTLIDGAHAPGMIDLNLNALGASAYTGNCHKWMCAPKGSGFLWLREDFRDRVSPLIISHGYNNPRTDRSRLHQLFDWTGTLDPSPYLCIPEALDTLAAMDPGGWAGIRSANHALAMQGNAILCDRLGIKPAAPESMLGSMATLQLPDAPLDPPQGLDYPHHLSRRLIDRWKIQAQIMAWPAWPSRLVRISAQRYNDAAEYAYLAEALAQELASEPA